MRGSLVVVVAVAACAPGTNPFASELGTSHHVLAEETAGSQCLTAASVTQILETLNKSTAPLAGELRLTVAECHKRVYLQGAARYVVWGTPDTLHGKGSSTTEPLPTAACIERALTLARELVPFGTTILDREAARNTKLWRDPDVGAVSYLQCDLQDQPVFTSVGTMLHETNHALAQGPCIFDFVENREICLDLDPALPRGTIAAYPRPPATLDTEAAKWLVHVQTLYLVRNGQGLLELLDEVMAYRASAEWTAVGLETDRYATTGPPSYINLPLMMALITRYMNELARREPALAAKEFGPHGRHRAAVIGILDGAEGSYRRWLQAARAPTSFESTLWDDYQRDRQRWLGP